MLKTKKGLILYQTMTGNTEKVALRFKAVFERKGWECDIFKIDKETDADNLPFDFKDYDFICVGSGVYSALPGKEITKVLDRVSHTRKRAGKMVHISEKITPGPKTGIVFATYAGAHLGPQEVEPTLSLLDLYIQHLKFICIGRFACPGGIGENKPTPKYWYGDISKKPDERDFQKAEIFLEEKLEESLLRQS
jgi:flavodoxin